MTYCLLGSNPEAIYEISAEFRIGRTQRGLPHPRNAVRVHEDGTVGSVVDDDLISSHRTQGDIDEICSSDVHADLKE